MLERTPTPLEARIIAASSIGLGLCESLAVQSMISTAAATEHEYKKLGNGTPPLDNVIEVAFMWQQITDFSIEGVH
jgi:hypothetical protein